MENLTSEQELKQLLEEGKISEEEYQQLLSAMSNKSNQEKEQQVSRETEFSAFTNRKIPNLLWIALVSLAFMVFIKIAYASKTGPLILIDAVISAILLVGIYLGHKWAYIATIIFVLLGTLSGFAKNPMYSLQIFCIDSLVLVPVLFCTNYFFPKSRQDD